jgi:FtsZ-binding cell division protein ZapB
VKKKTTEEQMSLAGTEEGEILARLSERVERAVQTIQELRKERDRLKAELAERGQAESEELERLKSERGEIKDRIESILGSLEALESTD